MSLFIINKFLMSGKLLYQLQLRLKKNAVNKTRKKEEINGLKKIFNEEKSKEFRKIGRRLTGAKH